MKEKRAYGKGYLEGYEAGLSEAWEELIGLTMKGYSGREIRIVANTKRGEIGKSVGKMQAALEKELGIPLEEMRPAGGPGTDIRPGRIHLVESRDLAKAAMLYNSLTDGDGLCIARVTPEELSDLYSISGRSIWLTRAELGRTGSEAVQEHVSPTELPRINSTIRSFVNGEGGKVVLLEGIDYLILNNGMEKVTRFLNSIKDEVYLAKAIMLVCIDPSRMPADDLTSLRNGVGLSV